MHFYEVRSSPEIFKKARYSKNVQNSRSGKRSADCKNASDTAEKGWDMQLKTQKYRSKTQKYQENKDCPRC